MNRLGILLIFEIELKYAVLLLNKENFEKIKFSFYNNDNKLNIKQIFNKNQIRQLFHSKINKNGNNEQKIYIFKLISTNYVDISEKITIFYRIHKLYENMII